jgi:ABC transporter
MRRPAKGGVAVRCERVEVELGHAEIVKRVSLDIPAGTFVGLVGPNGSGKTTLLRAIYRSLRPRVGLITVDGDNVWKLTPNEAAKRTSVVAQLSPVACGPPTQALAPDLVSRVFHVTATAFEHPITGSHQLFFDHPARGIPEWPTVSHTRPAFSPPTLRSVLRPTPRSGVDDGNPEGAWFVENSRPRCGLVSQRPIGHGPLLHGVVSCGLGPGRGPTGSGHVESCTTASCMSPQVGKQAL